MSTVHGYDRESAAVQHSRFIVRWHDGESVALPYRDAWRMMRRLPLYGGRNVTMQRVA